MRREFFNLIDVEVSERAIDGHGALDVLGEGLASLLYHKVFRLKNALWVRLLLVVVEVEYLVSLDHISIVHQNGVKVSWLEVKGLDLLQSQLTDV